MILEENKLRIKNYTIKILDGIIIMKLEEIIIE